MRGEMAEELGRIEKPAAEDFKKGRKLYFVPLLFGGDDAPPEYMEKYNRYWEQVENQIIDLESKLGQISRIYHEMVTFGGDDGIKAIESISDKSFKITKVRIDGGAGIEATEESGILTEFIDWSRCLSMGLQNQKVFTRVYESLNEASKARNQSISNCIDQTLKSDEAGILFMREGHQVQFPSDIEVFYIAPPALDEINRWMRDLQNRQMENSEPEKEPEPDSDLKTGEKPKNKGKK